MLPFLTDVRTAPQELAIPLHQRPTPIRDGFIGVTRGLHREGEGTVMGKVARESGTSSRINSFVFDPRPSLQNPSISVRACVVSMPAYRIRKHTNTNDSHCPITRAEDSVRIEVLNHFWRGWIGNFNLHEKVCVQRMLLANQFKRVCKLLVVSLALCDQPDGWRNDKLKKKIEADE